MRIRLKYPDEDTFIRKYSPNINRNGMFIQSRVPPEVGTVLRFQVVLSDGTSLLHGKGRVVWIKEYDAKSPTKAHGMGVRFLALDESSRELIERVMILRDTAPKPDKAPNPEDVPAQITDRPEPEPEALDAQPDESVEEQEQELAQEQEREQEQEQERGQEQEREQEQEQEREQGELSPTFNNADETPVLVPRRKGGSAQRSEDTRGNKLESISGEISGPDQATLAVPESEPTLDDVIAMAAASGGNGLAEILGTAESALEEILKESGLPPEQVDLVLARAVSTPVSTDGLDDLDGILDDLSPATLEASAALEMLDRLPAAVIAYSHPEAQAEAPAPMGESTPQQEGQETQEPEFASQEVPEADTVPLPAKKESEEERSVFSSLLEEAAALEKEVEIQQASEDTVPRARPDDEAGFSYELYPDSSDDLSEVYPSVQQYLRGGVPAEPEEEEEMDIDLDGDDDEDDPQMDEAATRVVAADLFDRPPPAEPDPGEGLLEAPPMLTQPAPAPDLPGPWASEPPEPRSARRNYLDELEDDTISDVGDGSGAFAVAAKEAVSGQSEEGEEEIILDVDALEEASMEDLALLQKAPPAPGGAPPPIPREVLGEALPSEELTPVVEPMDEMDEDSDNRAKSSFFKRLFSKK